MAKSFKKVRKVVRAAKSRNVPHRASNPLLARWLTPFAMPPFERLEPAHFPPAFRKALEQHRAEVRKIAGQTARPTFVNTLRALELSGRLLNRVSDVFFNLAGAHTNEALQEIERNLAPKLAAHQSAIYLDWRLFQRIDALYENRHHLALGAEDARLLERTHTAFVRAGARLNKKSKARVAEINGRLATLTTRFAQNVLADEQSWHMLLEGEAELAGLPDSIRAAAARAAADLGRPDKHAITLARSSVESFLQFSARRDLREEAFKAWTRRGEMNAKTDNRKIVAEVIALRAELAGLLGYASFASYALDDTMARAPDVVRELLQQVWPPALKRVGEECEALQGVVHGEGANFFIAAWDWRYYAEKVRKARYDFEDSEVRTYFQLDRMIEAAFDVAHRLFGLSFEERTDLPRYHPDVRTWEVKSAAGKHFGVFLGDYFARPSKRSGAWMSSYRDQHKLGAGSRPIIVNVLNCARGADGEPTLLSFDDARTLFHEFGHGLHGLLSDVTYPSLSGTNVTRDFVELPSQLYEHWLEQPEVLKRYAVHYKTGRPIPDKLLERIKAARTFNQGFATTEYAASAFVDLDLHGLDDTNGLDVTAFEKSALRRLGMPKQIVMRHRIPHFLHIMGGYAAAYYSYLWSEVMDADAFEAFEEAGDIFHAKTAARLKEYVYSAGNTRDPREAYIGFRGRPPKIDGLLKKRGLAAT